MLNITVETRKEIRALLTIFSKITFFLILIKRRKKTDFIV